MNSGKWYNIPLAFFNNSISYILLNDEMAGSNLIRADIKLGASSAKYIPFRSIKPPEPLSLTADKLSKLLLVNLIRNKYSEDDAKKLASKIVIKMSHDHEYYLNNRVKKDLINRLKNNSETEGLADDLISIINRSIQVSKDCAREQEVINLLNCIKNNTPLEQILKDEGQGSSNYNSRISLKIVNCSHGNWNEVHAYNRRYFYDLGAGLNLTKLDIDNFSRLRFSQSLIVNQDLTNTYKNIVIISHWDKDHYQSLFNINDHDLKKLTCS